jgi:hypothetical protein
MKALIRGNASKKIDYVWTLSWPARQVQVANEFCALPITGGKMKNKISTAGPPQGSLDPALIKNISYW